MWVVWKVVLKVVSTAVHSAARLVVRSAVLMDGSTVVMTVDTMGVPMVVPKVDQKVAK